LLIPAKESAFLGAYNEIVTRFMEKSLVKELKDIFERFLTEIGLKNVKVKLVGGYPEVFVEDLWGKVLPLEESPSGVREAITIALAFATEGEGVEALFIEEVEAHLHPKALNNIIELAWNSVLIRERSPVYLIMTIHNPIVLSKLNNLILKTGDEYHRIVSVIHFKKVNGFIESEEVKVSREGFDESSLGEIFIELLEERGEIA